MRLISAMPLLLLIGTVASPVVVRANDPVQERSIWQNLDTPQMTQQQYFTTMDADRSGSLDRKEYEGLTRQGHGFTPFDELDVNHDGKLSLAELEGNEFPRMAGN